jgi:hypothetical protein
MTCFERRFKTLWRKPIESYELLLILFRLLRPIMSIKLGATIKKQWTITVNHKTLTPHV